jgi:chemotaxis methyl-accepting protein methylase
MTEKSTWKLAAETLKTNRTLARTFFEVLYLKKRGAYRGKNKSYEEQRDVAFSLLDDRNYSLGLEVGCGEGFTTHRIASLCDRVIATDVSAVALKRAQERNEHLDGVEFRQHDLVRDNLDACHDYVFCGEVLYYFTYDQLIKVVERLARSIRAGGTLHLMHHRAVGDDEFGLDKAFGARTIHDMFADRDDMSVAADHSYDRLRATVLKKLAPA